MTVSQKPGSSLPRVVFTDIDGVWTDGGMYYSENGDESKCFNTSDSVGVHLLQALGIEIVILTGENAKSVERRAAKLRIDAVLMGVRDKLRAASSYMKSRGLALSNAAYIGNDVNDIDLLTAVRFSACPSDAPEYVKVLVKCIVPVKGGNGAFRYFAEYLLNDAALLEAGIERLRQSYRES